MMPVVMAMAFPLTIRTYSSTKTWSLLALSLEVISSVGEDDSSWLLILWRPHEHDIQTLGKLFIAAPLELMYLALRDLV